MILVDSSVWIDFFKDRHTVPVQRFISLFDQDVLAVADLVIVEVLQGTRSEWDFHACLDVMSRFPVITVSDRDLAVEAARYYRQLRTLGFTIRKTIDTLIATRCIVDGHALLYSDHDFDPFVAHLGLQSALD